MGTIKPTAFEKDSDITSLRKELMGVWGNEDHYHQILRDLPIAVYTCDIKGRILFYNKAAAELWGREPQLGKDLWCGSWKIYNPDGSQMAPDDCPMAITLKEGRPVDDHEVIIERPDGVRRYVMPHPKPVFDSSGQLRGAVNMLTDITKQKNSDRALRESEERLRLAAETSGLGTWDLNIKSGMTVTSEQHRQIFDYAKDSAWSLKRYLAQVHPEDMHIIENAFEEGKRTGKMLYEARVLRPDSTVRWIRVNAATFYDEKKTPARMVGTVMDITNHKEMHDILERTVSERTAALQNKTDQLKKSEEQYHRMVDEVQDYAIVLLNRDGIIQNWNKGAQKIKGYGAEEIIGKHVRIFYQKADQESRLPERLMGEAAKNGRAVLEGWRVRKDGSLFWGSIVITAMHDENQNIIGFSKVTRDLTERKEAEEELLRFTRRLEEKNTELERSNYELEQFAYIASHDLQEPLRKIQTFASLLEKNLDDPVEAKKYFDKINSSASRMSTLIRDVLNYSRLSKTKEKFEMTDLNQILENVKSDFELLIREKEAELRVTSLPVISGIPHQLHQLFLNLVSNSLKFSRRNPVIEITAEILSENAIKQYPKLLPDIKYVHIRFQDNGIGFEQKYAEQIFTIFQRLNTRNSYSGTGIGLALCKKIIENHQGFINATGEPDKGAVFNIILPVSQ